MKILLQWPVHRYGAWFPGLMLGFCILIGATLGFNAPSTDFYFFYHPNALNFLNDGTWYSLPDGTTYLSSGNIHAHGQHPPAYALLLACLYTLGIKGYGILWVNALLLMVAFHLFDQGAENLGIARPIRRWSLLAAACFPVTWFMPLTYGSESLFTLFFAFMWLGWMRWMKGRDWIGGMEFLLGLTAATLTRSGAVLLGLLPMICLLIPSFRTRSYAVFAGMSLVVSLALFGAQSGPEADTYLRRSVADGLKRVPIPLADSLVSDCRHKSEWKPRMRETLSHAAPAEWLQLAGIKFTSVWYRTDSGRLDAFLFFPGMLMLLVFIGFPFSPAPRNVVGLLWLPLAYQAALTSITLSICRYMAPLLPLLFIMGGIMVSRLSLRFRPHGN